MNDNNTWVVVYNGSLYPTISVKTVSAVNSNDTVLNRYMRTYGTPQYYCRSEEAWVTVYENRHTVEAKYGVAVNLDFSDVRYDIYRRRIERAR